MPFIKLRKLRFSEDGAILSGSAGLIDTQYVSGKTYHSKQIQRENLGKVIWLSEDRRSGIFNSPERGLVEYSADLDRFADVQKDDSRLPDDRFFPVPPVHTIFGDIFFITSFLKNSIVLEALKDAFSDKKQLERLLVHLAHTIAKDGSHISESVKCKICPNEKRPEIILLIDRRYLRPFLHLQALKIPAAKAHFSLRVLVFSVLIRSSSGIFGE